MMQLIQGSMVIPLLAFIANIEQCYGLELDCKQEAMLVRGARPLIDVNSSYAYRWLLVVLSKKRNNIYLFTSSCKFKQTLYICHCVVKHKK